MSEIKVCPFCGDTNTEPQFFGEFTQMSCCSCYARGPIVRKDRDASVPWNRRAMPDVVRDLLDLINTFACADNRNMIAAIAAMENYYKEAR